MNARSLFVFSTLLFVMPLSARAVEKGQAAAPSATLIAKRPVIPPRVAWSAPTPVMATTRAGAKLLSIEQHALPLVHVSAVVGAGSALDPKDKPGLAAAVAMMLEEGGAGARNSVELAQAIDDLGGELAVTPEEGGVRFFLTVGSRDLDRALALFGDLLARPRFEETEWPRVREQRIAEILRKRDEPREVADDVFKQVLFGEHVYAHPVLGDRAAVEKLTLDDLRAFYAAHYGPKTVSLILVGDLSPAAALKSAERAFAGWSSQAQSQPAPLTVTQGPARIILVDRPGAPQSEVRVGHIGLSFAGTDLPASELLSMVLGGSFTSRLVQNLREKHGYTYGAHSQFHVWRSPGPFEASAAVRTEVTGPALKEMVEELKGMLTPLTPDEIGKARALVEAEIVEQFSDGLAASSQIGELIMHEAAPDFFSKLPAKLAVLDGPGLTKAATRLFHPEALTIVVVGDRKLVEPQLRLLPFGKALELRDEDGAVVRAK